MKRQQMVINTIAFMEQIQEGQQQMEFFARLKAVGMETVEVRQEYFGGLEEMRQTAQEANRLGMKLFYSVPRPLFMDGCLDKEGTEQAFAEAETLGVQAIKWTCGEFTGWSDADLDWMKQRATSFDGILTVENDQTMEDGTVEGIAAFLAAAKAVELPILCTFDAGNWAWVGEESLLNARRLGEFVGYIHMKDVVVGDGPKAVALGSGELPLTEILAVLPKDAPIALEYPCGARPFEVIEHGLLWLERIYAGLA